MPPTSTPPSKSPPRLEATAQTLLNQVWDLFSLALEKSPDLEQMLPTFQIPTTKAVHDSLDQWDPIAFLAKWKRVNPSLPPRRVAEIADQDDPSLPDLRTVAQAAMQVLSPETD
jgi:hypothetical protein